MPKPNIGQGDSGKTSLLGGRRKVWKDSAQVEAYGSLDELVSLLGYIRAKCGVSDTPHKPPSAGMLDKKLLKIQDHLFRIESHVSASEKWKTHPALPYMGDEHVKFLLDAIADYEKDLPELKNFILPGGSELAALFHIARAKSRQVERRLITLNKSKKIHNKFAIPYVNRLSDAFFAMARWVNWRAGVKDTDWVGRGRSGL